MKKIIKNTRLHFLVIAVSLALTTTVLGLSAYLTDHEEMTSTFVTVSGDQFGISLSGTEYTDQTILPGDTIEIAPTVTNEGNYDAYVFVETAMDGDFAVDMNTFDDQWTQLQDGVYYYGSAGSVTPFSDGASSSPFENIIYSSAADDQNGTPLEVTVSAYAVQAANITNTNAASVWSLAHGE